MSLLDQIIITRNAHDKYINYAEEMGEFFKKNGITSREIPDEDAILLDDGRIEIFVIAREWRISFFLEKDEWEFIKKP